MAAVNRLPEVTSRFQTGLDEINHERFGTFETLNKQFVKKLVLKMLFAGPIQTYTGLLRGIYDTVFPMVMSVLTSWLITLPLAYIFGIFLKFGVIGIVVASSFAEIILAFGLCLRWKYRVSNKS